MTVSCEHCGTANRANANFCIGCAGQLPGFVPTGPSALQMLRGKERAAASAAGRASPSGREHGSVAASIWLRRLLAGGLLVMVSFIGWYLHVTQAPATRSWHANAPVVQLQPAFVQLAPFEPEVAAPAPVPEVPQLSADALDTVAGFYRALSAGDGSAAAALVVPAKRTQGPLSVDAMSAFYRSLKEPLMLRSVKQVDAQRVEARYTYRATRATGTACEGRALVTMESPGPTALIRSIAANC